VAALLAMALGVNENLSFVLVLIGVVAHISIALNATRLALRFLPAWVAAAVGIVTLIDTGSISSGGVMGTIEYGLVHSAISQAFGLAALVSVIDSLRRPRLRTSISIWIWTALSTIAHPAGLLGVGVAVMALVMVALLARDVPARRPLIAVLHLVLGTAVAAWIWLPLGERIALYAQHFSDVLPDPGHRALELLVTPMPVGAFSALVYIGYAATFVGLISRRAIPIFVAVTVIAMVLATFDAPYLSLGLAPSRFVARLGSMRFYMLVRPFVFIAAGYLVCAVAPYVRARWQQVDRRSLLIPAFIAGVLGGVGIRFGCQASTHLVSGVHVSANHHQPDTEPFVAWAREQMKSQAPDHFGRAVVIDTKAYYAHITSLARMPTLSPGPLPVVLLRERFETLEPDSLRRFNIRWVVSADSSKEMVLGDPTTEQRLGSFRVREYKEWDGQFARIEKGTGRAVVTRLDDDGVDVDLRDTTEPALVALGMGYYPRWHAIGPDGKSLAVYAFPATVGGNRHVLAAWLPPGTTHFRSDGSLPSDSDGTVLSISAALSMIALVIAWSRRRYRSFLLRWFARMRRTRRLPRFAPHLVVALVAASILVWGAIASSEPARALQLGSGIRPTATVEYKAADGTWTECDYLHSIGEFRCDTRAAIRDTTVALVNDEQVGWPYTTPAFAIFPLEGSLIHVRVTFERRLAGTYWTKSTDTPVDITIDSAAPVTTDKQRAIELVDRDHTIVVQAPPTAVPIWVTFVREDTLLPDLQLPLAPDEPPPR
jgi:hypothetical protein